MRIIKQYFVDYVQNGLNARSKLSLLSSANEKGRGNCSGFLRGAPVQTDSSKQTGVMKPGWSTALFRLETRGVGVNNSL